MIFRNLKNLWTFCQPDSAKMGGDGCSLFGEITFAINDTKVSMDTIVSLFRSMASGDMALVQHLS
jgi:hypothetical protein